MRMVSCIDFVFAGSTSDTELCSGSIFFRLAVDGEGDGECNSRFPSGNDRQEKQGQKQILRFAQDDKLPV
jgi:hypothetical protein